MKKFRPKPKKKIFKLLIPVKEFLRDQPGEVKQELNGLSFQLERDGYLNYPNAEKVEDEPTYRHCKDIGSDYFQGFYFAKPEIVTGQKIDATSAAILEIIKLLRTRPTLEVLCDEFDKHPDISANLLQFVNSDIRNKPVIENVKGAIVWVGMKHIQEWLTIMLYAHLDTRS